MYEIYKENCNELNHPVVVAHGCFVVIGGENSCNRIERLKRKNNDGMKWETAASTGNVLTRPTYGKTEFG